MALPVVEPCFGISAFQFIIFQEAFYSNFLKAGFLPLVDPFLLFLMGLKKSFCSFMFCIGNLLLAILDACTEVVPKGGYMQYC